MQIAFNGHDSVGCGRITGCSSLCSQVFELQMALPSMLQRSKIVSVWSLSFFDDDEEQWGHTLEF